MWIDINQNFGLAWPYSYLFDHMHPYLPKLTKYYFGKICYNCLFGHNDTKPYAYLATYTIMFLQYIP